MDCARDCVAAAVERVADDHRCVRLKDCDENLQVSRRLAAQALRQIRGGH